MQGRSLEEAARRLADGHRALVADRVLEPLASDAHDTQRWMDCDLASFVENRLFETIDPTMLTDDLRRAWTARATRPDERIESPHERAWYVSPFWLLAAGERVGTIALANSLAGADVVSVWSLYVTPRHRRRGIAGRALRRCDAVLRGHGARGLRIPTSWLWQAAVRFYLGLGFWVASWKHGLTFTQRQDLPSYRILEDRGVARLEIRRVDAWRLLIVAENRGERLGWHEEPAVRSPDGHPPPREAPGTLATALAVRGWPLIRSEEAWARRHRWSDTGEPEGLAYKIEIFEALDRRHGFTVRAPRIPGLRYRDLDEID